MAYASHPVRIRRDKIGLVSKSPQMRLLPKYLEGRVCQESHFSNEDAFDTSQSLSAGSAISKSKLE